MKKKNGEIFYSLNYDDLQAVADDLLERPLTKKEITLVADSVGDYIDWSQAVEFAIRKHIEE